MSTELNHLHFAAIKNWGDEKWVVTTPSGKSTVDDILFKTTAHGLVLQIFGGLEHNRILLVTPDEQKARETAELLIGVQNGCVQSDIKKLRDAVTSAYDHLIAGKYGDAISELFPLTNK